MRTKLPLLILAGLLMCVHGLTGAAGSDSQSFTSQTVSVRVWADITTAPQLPTEVKIENWRTGDRKVFRSDTGITEIPVAPEEAMIDAAPLRLLLAQAFRVPRHRVLLDSSLTSVVVYARARPSGFPTGDLIDALKGLLPGTLNVTCELRKETTAVLTLRVVPGTVPTLKSTSLFSWRQWADSTRYSSPCTSVEMAARQLERVMGVYIVDETNLDTVLKSRQQKGELNVDGYGFGLQWDDPTTESLNRALRTNYHLELVPAHREMELLHVAPRRPDDPGNLLLFPDAY